MYNGIGLETARGSGTNGYVTRNLSAIRNVKQRVDYKSEEELKKFEAQFNKKPNQEILEHDKKRKVELKCFEMRVLMEEQGFTDEEIEDKVTHFRKLLMEKESASEGVSVTKDDFGRPVATETHQIALAQEEKNAKWRDAFGIAERDDEKRDREKRESGEKSKGRDSCKKDSGGSGSRESRDSERKERKKDKKHSKEHKTDRNEEKKKHKKRRSRSRSRSRSPQSSHKSKRR